MTFRPSHAEPFYICRGVYFLHKTSAFRSHTPSFSMYQLFSFCSSLSVLLSREVCKSEKSKSFLDTPKDKTKGKKEEKLKEHKSCPHPN